MLTPFFLLLGVALATPLSPDAAVAAALATHPDLARAEAELAAAEAPPRLRENPELEGGVALVGNTAGSRAGHDTLDVALTQPLSLAGPAERAHQRARRDAAEAAAARARLAVAAETRAAYVSAVVAHQDAALAAQAFDLATRQLAATDARVRAGEAADLDLRLARLDQARVAGELLAARAAEAAALATLATLVQRPLAGDDLAADPLAAAPEPTPEPTPERADVQAARLALEAADAAVRRERAAAVPFTVGAFYTRDGDERLAGPTLGLTLPLWHQNQAGIAEARGEAGVARAELAATRARADAEARAAAAAHADALATMSAVPATAEDATAALAAIASGARSGELDLATTILLRDEVVAGQQGLIDARGQLATSRITLLLATEDLALLGGAP